MSKNQNLQNAKKQKNDEFYTRLEDIEAEISMHPDYVRHFKDKIVFCNCDDPESSNFFQFFRLHFNQLGIKKLITTHFNKDGSPSYKLEWEGEMLHDDTLNMIKTPLGGGGDFRSPECVEILKEADIVVSNPPFSLFRIYVAQLMEYDKKFIIIGNINAITYKEIFPLIKDGKIFAGYHFNKTMLFRVGDGYAYDPVSTAKINDGNKYGKVPGIAWYTNLDIDKRHEDLPLTKNYYGNEDKYPKYDNYDAINVDKVKDIPKDYDGVMGVPITFMDAYNPEQFEIIGLDRYTVPKQFLVGGRVAIKGKPEYARILISNTKINPYYNLVKDSDIMMVFAKYIANSMYGFCYNFGSITLKRGTLLYRVRKDDGKTDFSEKKQWGPSPFKAEGRCNNDGETALYLGSNKLICMLETNVLPGETCFIGTYQCNDDIVLGGFINISEDESKYKQIAGILLNSLLIAPSRSNTNIEMFKRLEKIFPNITLDDIKLEDDLLLPYEIAAINKKQNYHKITNKICNILKLQNLDGIRYSSCYFPVETVGVKCSAYNVVLYKNSISKIDFVDYERATNSTQLTREDTLDYIEELVCKRRNKDDCQNLRRNFQ